MLTLSEITAGTQQQQSSAFVRISSRSPTPRAPATFVAMVGPAQMTRPRMLPKYKPVGPAPLTLDTCSDANDLGGPAGALCAQAVDVFFFFSFRRADVRRTSVHMYFEVSVGLVPSSIVSATVERFFVGRCPVAADTVCVPAAFGSPCASGPSDGCLACLSALNLSGGVKRHTGVGGKTKVPTDNAGAGPC